MEETEGVIVVEFDELLDPRPNGKKPGTFYHFVSVKRPGQGTAELFLTADLYAKIKSFGLKSGAQLALIFKLSKWQGQFEPRLSDVVAG